MDEHRKWSAADANSTNHNIITCWTAATDYNAATTDYNAATISSLTSGGLGDSAIHQSSNQPNTHTEATGHILESKATYSQCMVCIYDLFLIHGLLIKQVGQFTMLSA